jgi:polyphosphate glucokinase
MGDAPHLLMEGCAAPACAGRILKRMTADRIGLGIDVGGTGVKAALVDLTNGALVSERVRMRTPDPSTPEAVVEVIGEIVDRLARASELPANMPVGCGLPGVVVDDELLTAANIDSRWLDVPAAQLIGERIGRRVHLVNDADAAGMAEMAFGVGRGRRGTVLMLTVGTGIGSALFRHGVLVPNTELGHLRMNGRAAETRLSGVARERRGLKWRSWASEFNAYLERLEAYLWPDLIIFGGGVSKSFPSYADRLKTRAPVVAAEFLNAAGIVGAAMHSADIEGLVEPPLPTDGQMESVLAEAAEAAEAAADTQALAPEAALAGDGR